ncbi:MAG TPA: M3 family metallopeptidase, partial [Deinococcales bacterium]|nr:M3 family metallopeptidase [Deinococcales bacterium]
MARAAKSLVSDDRGERETAWRALSQRRAQDAPRLHELYLEMLRVRRQVARNAGFETFTDYVFRDYHRDYTPADCLAFHDSIAGTIVPAMETIQAERRESLGLGSLRPWDDDQRAAPDAKGRAPLQPFEDPADLEAGVARMVANLDPELGTLFDSLRQHRDLDLDARANKAPGGYHARLPYSRRSYIFMSAAGTHENVTTL